MQDKRLFFFLPSLSGGGAEKVYIQLAKEFAVKGYHVDLVVANGSGVFKSQIDDRVKLHDLNAKKLFFSVGKIASKINELKPDVIFSTLFRANSVISLASLFASHKAKLILREATVLSLDLGLYSQPTKTLFSVLAKKAYRSADAVIALSTPSKDDLSHFCKIDKDDIYLVSNPASTSDIEVLANESYEPLWDNSAPTICFVGRLEEQKNLPFFLSAFSELVTRKQTNLMILGRGSLESELKEQVESLGLSQYVKFMGFQTNPFKYIKRADLLVLPSKWEGFPNVLIQSLSIGTPVIASNCPGASGDILEQGKFGRLFELGNKSQLVNEMYQQLFIEPKRLDLEDVAYLKSKYALENIVSSYESVIRDLYSEV